MPTQDKDLNNNVVFKIVGVSEVLFKTANKFFKKYHVTTVQYNVLVILNSSKTSVNQNDIGRQLVVSRSNITGIVDRLERAGYVTRVAGSSDRRVKFILLTAKGRKLISTVEEEYFKTLTQTLRYLSAEEKNNVVAIMGKIERGAA